MIKRLLKFSKNLAVFLMIAGILFSNIPFYALTGLIDSYEKMSGIVDKIWLVQQENNSEVVDNFSTLRNISEKLRVKQAMAAINFVGGASASGTNAAYNMSLTSLAGGIGSAPATNDIVIVVNVINNVADGNPGVGTAGYTEPVDIFNIADTYDTNLSVSYKVMGASPDTLVSCNPSSGTTIASNCVAMVFRGIDTATPLDVTTTTATGQNAEDVNCPAITPVTSGAIVVCAGGGGGASVDQVTPTAPTGYSGSTFKQTDPGSAGGAVASYKAWSGSGAEDPAAYVMDLGTASANSWNGATLALRPADTTAPTPDPMTFATAPANDSATQISMTATTATDASTPPVSYYFALDTTSCTGANVGTGAADSGWQSGTGYTDTGLDVNKCYGYKVKARDSVGTPNETGYSGITTLYTSANTPGTPTLGSPTTSTLNLTNAENSNPAANPTTNFAVQVVTTTPNDATWLNQWVNGSGSPSATAVWLTDAQLDALVLQGLQASTLYGVKVKARNQDTDETALSAEGQGTTSAPSQTLAIAVTAGSKVTTLNSGDVNQYVHSGSCTAESNCSAFKMTATGGTVTVTSIKITQNGTTNATTNLSDLNLYYDTDADPTAGLTLYGTTATFTAGAATVTGSVGIPVGTPYYFYVRVDLANGAAYPSGGETVNFQILANGDVASNGSITSTAPYTLAGTTTVLPNATGITYTVNSDGGRSGDTATISGYGFGAGTNRADCTTATVDYGCVKFIVGGTTNATSTNFTSWSNTQIVFTINATLGTEGGASAVQVRTANQADTTPLTYYVYPRITGFTATFSDGGYQDGTITLLGDHLGASGAATDISFNGQNPGSVGTWASTTIATIDTPNAGTDSGTITVTRASDSKASNASATFYIYPQITGFTNTTDGTLTDGGRQTHVVTITGNHFGTGGGNSNIFINGTAPSATTPTWGTGSITNVDISDGGTDSGVITVTNPGTSKTSNNSSAFYIYPSVVTITNCNNSGFPAGAYGREYDAGDAACPNTLTDGAIIINGNHFGAAGSVTILGSTATQSAVAAFCSGAAYNATCISVQVPTAIANNAYTGDLIVSRTAGTKTDTLSGFRVLPRITGFNPSSGAVGTAVAVNGNHFCQSGTCPTGSVGTDTDLANAPAFTTNDRVTFTSSVVADYWDTGGWTDTAINTQVPSGAVTGNATTTSASYTSNAVSFTVSVPTPTTPTTLWQSRNSAFTDFISTGGVASTTPVYFSATTSSSITGGTMYMQTEIRPIGTSFSSTCAGNAYCFEGSGVGPYGGGDVVVTSSTTTADDFYHWQTRARYYYSATDYFGAWQCYPDPSCNGEASTDFQVSTVAPVISGISSSVITNTGTVGWTTNKLATTQLEYGTSPTLTGSTFTAITDTPPGTNGKTTGHSVTVSNLNCGTTYYYRARSRDTGNLEGTSAIQSFDTLCPTQPAKTATFHIFGLGGSVSGGTATSTTFTIDIPETATSTQSAFVELSGIFTSGASSQNVDVQFNSQGAKTYVLPVSSTSHFKIIHQIEAGAITGLTNTLTVTPQANTTLYISSARLTITYAYTP